MTNTEKNEAIARRLGWKKLTNLIHWETPKRFGWEQHSYSRLRDWYGDDGLAFAEVFPALCAWIEGKSGDADCFLDYGTLGRSQGQPRRKLLFGWFETELVDSRQTRSFSGEKWPHIICDAAIALLPEVA